MALGTRSSSDLESNGIEKSENVAHKESVGTESTASPSGQDVSSKWTFTRCIAIASLCLVYVGAQALLYFVGGSLSYIGQDIGSSFTNWLLTANTLAVTAICPFVGYITDLLGRRYVCIFGSLCLIVGSVVQATSKSLGSSVAAMAIGGIGAGICELIALAGVAELTPVRWRGVTLSVVTFSILPFIPYILYIEELHAHSTWRWGLGIVAIWNGLGAIGIILAYHPPPRHNVDGLSSSDILRRIDWGGALISITGVTLFLVGLQYGGYQVPWTDGKALGPLIVGIILIIAWPIYEVLVPKHPMVPGAIFRGQNVVAISYGVVFIAGMLFYSVLGFFPIMLQQLYTAGPVTTGLRGLGYPLAILAGACSVSTLLSYTNGHVREMFIIMSAIMTAFAGALASSTPFTPGQATAFATLSSFGIGGIIVPPLTVALYACPDEYIGTTAALSLSVRFLGGSVGTAIYFNIFNNKLKTLLPAKVVPAVTQAGLPMDQAAAFVQALSADPTGMMASMIPGVTPEILQAGGLQAKWALAESLDYVWYAAVAFGVVAIVASCFLPNIRQFMSNRLAVDIH